MKKQKQEKNMKLKETINLITEARSGNWDKKCRDKKEDRRLGIGRFPLFFSHGIYLPTAPTVPTVPTAPSSFIFTSVQANFEGEKIYDGSAKERKHIGK